MNIQYSLSTIYKSAISVRLSVCPSVRPSVRTFNSAPGKSRDLKLSVVEVLDILSSQTDFH